MKKLLAILLAFSLAAALAACGGPSDEEIKAVRNVSFEGTELTVTLGTNRSTGYEWDHEIYGDCIKPSINRSFKVIGSKGDATGEVSIGFEGLLEGSATIVFTTPNGWDGAGNGDGYTVSVEVNADGTIQKATGMVGTFPAARPEPTATSAPELAEGTYTGTLSGDSWANNKGTMFTAIPSAELTVTVQDGQVTLYCEAQASADGEIEGVAAPHSPEYTVIVSGSLPLAQSSDAIVSAEGDVPMLGETLVIHYNDGGFTHWEVKERSSDSTYYCTVSITMVNGIPVAEITVDGKLSHQTATVPLRLAAQGGPDAEAECVLWSNIGAGEVQQGARDYYMMFPLPDCLVTELVTDHRLSGGKMPGQLMLFSEDGSEYGPFDATGREGADGTANACWVAEVNIDLPAGRYAVADSDQATWSCNDDTDGWGMATVRGILK